MGHQNNVVSTRLVLTNRWTSKWSVNFQNKSLYKFLVHQDLLIQQFLKEFFLSFSYNILKPIIKRSFEVTHIFVTLCRVDQQLLPSFFNSKRSNKFKIKKKFQKRKLKSASKKKKKLFTLKPFLRKDLLLLQSLLKKFTNTEVFITISFVTNLFFDAAFLGHFLVKQIESKIRQKTLFKIISRYLKLLRKKKKHRRTLGRRINFCGLRIELSGRINGVDRARTVKYLWGSVPLNTFVKDISFSKQVANTKEGSLGIKTWITYKKK